MTRCELLVSAGIPLIASLSQLAGLRLIHGIVLSDMNSKQVTTISLTINID